MKIIDLLNKIANGEIDRNNKYKFSRDDYCTINDFFARYIVDEENLNLEIIEEYKKIEPLKTLRHSCNFDRHEETLYENEVDLARKITELIDEINKLKDESR